MNNRISIIFLIPNLAGGGAERILINIANNLDKNKYDVTIRTLFKENVNARYLGPDIRLIQGRLKQFHGNTSFLKLFSPKLLYGFFIKGHYDVAVSFLEGPTARIVAGCSDKRTKLVSWTHVEQHTIKVASSCFRSVDEATRLYGNFDQHVFVSNTVQNDFLSIFPSITNHIVLYNPVDDNYIREQSNEAIDDIRFSDSVNVISVGRLMEQKGYDRLIVAHKKLIDEGINHHIYILGTGNVELYKQMIIKNHVEKTFHLLGYKANPYKYVASADLFICSSRREGFSTAVAEALIVGTPVVSTLCSGAIELLGNDNEYGLIVENSEIGIYNGLLQMLTSLEKRRHYNKQALIRSDYFNMQTCMRRIGLMLERVINNL